MYYCLKCGKELKMGEKFCESCGEKTQFADMSFGKIKFKRTNNFYGCAIPFKVFIDKEQVGSLNAGAKLEFDYPLGEHEIAINKPEDKKRRTINLTEEKKEIEITVTVNLFALALVAKGKIKKID